MRKIKLLLVDDEEGFVRTMAQRLDIRGVSPQVALSGESALEMVDEDAPDVMVLDLRMPGIDGMKVLERVREDHPHVQVVILTGHGSEEERRRARELGAFDYLEKPADTGELLSTIKRAWKKALRALRESKEGFEGHMMAAAMAEVGEAGFAVEELEGLERSRSDREAAESVPDGPDEATSVNVLFVDDEEDFVRTMAERVRMRQVGGEVALTGEEALNVLEEDRPDVMVLDLRMPGMGGMEVLRTVKKRHPGVEVVILTGHGSARDEAEALRLGAFAYLQKPVDFDILMETVRRAGITAREGAANTGPDREG